MLIIFLDIKRTVQSEFSPQARQSIPHTTVTFYDDCLTMCEDFAPKFCIKIGPLYHNNTPSHASMTVIPYACYLLDLAPRAFMFPQLKIPPFYTIFVMDAESQVMLNILTEHDFEDTFRKLAEELETAYA
jgi:hypothetical protein